MGSRKSLSALGSTAGCDCGGGGGGWGTGTGCCCWGGGGSCAGCCLLRVLCVRCARRAEERAGAMGLGQLGGERVVGVLGLFATHRPSPPTPIFGRCRTEPNHVPRSRAHIHTMPWAVRILLWCPQSSRWPC